MAPASSESTNYVILPCAGVGRRMGSSTPKFLLQLGGHSILHHTLAQIDQCDDVHEIVLVLSESFLEEFHQELLPHVPNQKISALVAGGSERQHSIFHGLRWLMDQAKNIHQMPGPKRPAKRPAPANSIVAVHDAVRPFASPSLFQAVIRRAQQHGAAIAGIPAQDTIKKVKGSLLERTLDRSQLLLAQTPQAFRLDLLWEANLHAQETQFIGTDDASLVEHFGKEVYWVDGQKNNLKMTTPEDLILGEALVKKGK